MLSRGPRCLSLCRGFVCSHGQPQVIFFIVSSQEKVRSPSLLSIDYIDTENCSSKAALMNRQYVSTG